MRWGLIADVHANLAALDAALAALRAADAERLICAGDVVGYGPQPNECIERLREAGAVCVVGNHEQIALGELPDEGIHEWATVTLRWTRTVLTPEHRDWIAALPPRAEAGGGIAVAHGSLNDTRTYVRTDEQAAGQLAALERARTLVLGHTHVPMLFEQDGRTLVNPGAVGQSRERRIRAAFALLDDATGAVRFDSAPYDTGATDRALAVHGLPPRTYQLRPPALRRAWLRLPAGVRRPIKRALGR